MCPFFIYNAQIVLSKSYVSSYQPLHSVVQGTSVPNFLSYHIERHICFLTLSRISLAFNCDHASVYFFFTGMYLLAVRFLLPGISLLRLQLQLTLFLTLLTLVWFSVVVNVIYLHPNSLIDLLNKIIPLYHQLSTISYVYVKHQNASIWGMVVTL